jgi:uncharacterized protein
MEKKPNDLINESSPYLLQHAYNPVQWKAWNDATLEEARKQNKLMLISVGYSACHWCHVMERECFEDPALAAIMNDHFINIKVDREERPDIDQVYMLAVQLMTGRGGWPLNCFALPDGRAFYGGTYFPNQQWKNVLLNIADLWMHEKDKIYDYADKLLQGMQISEIVKPESAGIISTDDLKKSVAEWMRRSDPVYGGPNKAPKFPLPVNYEFLLHYNYYAKDEKLEKHIRLTLDKISEGGIYDQAGGGFARYSTDQLWKVPHFEKMLYDNAQLVSLYSKAFLVYKDPHYKAVVKQTLEFIAREFTGKAGEFYSALDADSEHVEGKFYVWEIEELRQISGDDFEFLKELYHTGEEAEWEEKLILMRRTSNENLERKYDLTPDQLQLKIDQLNQKLLDARKIRVRPGLDDKALTSWNAMMVTGYLDAYKAIGDEAYLNAAIRNIDWILKVMRKDDGRLYHSYRSGKPMINAFLEDYAFVIQALLELYQCTFIEEYYSKAVELTKLTMDEFFDKETSIFYFTSKKDQQLIVRKPEINDNVIPASNSVMAHNLHTLFLYTGDSSYKEACDQFAGNFSHLFQDYPEGYANWGRLILKSIHPSCEVVVNGAKDKLSHELMKNPYPHKIFAATDNNSQIPLLQGRPEEKEDRIYVCAGHSCQAPVATVNEALTMLV